MGRCSTPGRSPQRSAPRPKLEILAAIRPIYHQPVQLTAKQAATLQYLTSGRFSINVVSGWWAEEARQYGIEFAAHDDRYAFTREYVDALTTLWRDDVANFDGEFIKFEGTHLQPKPSPAPHIFAGGESPAGRASISQYADSYLTHGGTVEELEENRRHARAPRGDRACAVQALRHGRVRDRARHRRRGPRRA